MVDTPESNMNCDDDKIRWVDNIGQSLIKSVEVTIGGGTYARFDGSGNPITKHENVSEADCLVCKTYKSQYKNKGNDFQYFYGTKHVYQNGIYDCYRGGLIIRSVDPEWVNLWKTMKTPGLDS